MKSSHRFSFQFDSLILREELERVRSEWVRHFNTGYYDGEWSGIPLRSPAVKNHKLSSGDSSSTMFIDEPMLSQVPYTKSVIDSILAEKMAVRYLKLTSGSEIKTHKDADMIFWDGFARLHIPIITNERVKFRVGKDMVCMKPGELWFADFSQPHSVINIGATDRIHLVIDLQVNDWLRNLFEKENIINQGEQKPDPIDSYPLELKREMMKSLIEMNTETSLKMAQDMAEKYGLQS